MAKWCEYSPVVTNLRICGIEYTIYHKKDGTYNLDYTGGYEESHLGNFSTLETAKRVAHLHIRHNCTEMEAFLTSLGKTV